MKITRVEQYKFDESIIDLLSKKTHLAAGSTISNVRYDPSSATPYRNQAKASLESGEMTAESRVLAYFHIFSYQTHNSPSRLVGRYPLHRHRRRRRRTLWCYGVDIAHTASVTFWMDQKPVDSIINEKSENGCPLLPLYVRYGSVGVWGTASASQKR